MHPANCCRTCIKNTNLNPIFKSRNSHAICSDVIFAATGIKVEINDALPQLMCSSCISFINISSKFRRKCQLVQQQLLEQMQRNTIKVESQDNLKAEVDTKINLDLSDVQSNYDYEEEISLDIFRYSTNDSSIDVNNEIENNREHENVTLEQTNQGIEPLKRNKKPTSIKNVKRKVRKPKAASEEGKSEPKKIVKEEIECEYCHKVLTSRLSLRNHYKIHTGFDVVCEHCGKKFITRRLLLMHCRAKHGYEKTDKCSFCDYRASNAEQVKIHERLHTGEKPYVCPQCSAGFHRNSTYQQHLAIHLPEKNVQCDQCSALFKSVTLMRIHKSRHRPSLYTFVCLICDNTFARRRNAVQHLFKSHGSTQMEDIKRIKKNIAASREIGGCVPDLNGRLNV